MLFIICAIKETDGFKVMSLLTSIFYKQTWLLVRAATFPHPRCYRDCFGRACWADHGSDYIRITRHASLSTSDARRKQDSDNRLLSHFWPL